MALHLTISALPADLQRSIRWHTTPFAETRFCLQEPLHRRQACGHRIVLEIF
jgi:hypothetical protein